MKKPINAIMMVLVIFGALPILPSASALTILSCDVTDTLQEGETKTYSINGKTFEVSNTFVSITQEQARFIVNGELSAATSPGQATATNGIAIRVDAITRYTNINTGSGDAPRVDICINEGYATNSEQPQCSGVSDRLQEGDTKLYTISGTTYELTTLYVRSNGVRFIINGQTSSILPKNSVETVGGANIQVNEIDIGGSSSYVSFCVYQPIGSLPKPAACAVSDTLSEGETKTYTIDGRIYEVTSLIVSRSPSYGKFIINGEITEQIAADKTVTTGGLSIHVNQARADSVEVCLNRGSQNTARANNICTGVSDMIRVGDSPKTYTVNGKLFETQVTAVTSSGAQFLLNGQRSTIRTGSTTSIGDAQVRVDSIDIGARSQYATACITTAANTQPQTCIADGQLDDTLEKTVCCSGQAVEGSTICSNAGDWFRSWESCTHICGTTGVTAEKCPYGPTGTPWCPCPEGTTSNGRYGVGVCQGGTAPTNNDMSIGNTNAPITMSMYGGHQEEFTRQFMTQIFPELKKEYVDTGRVRFEFKQYPIEVFNPNGMKNSEAVLCAARIGGDWYSFQEQLYVQADFSDAALERYAIRSNIDGARFTECLRSGVMKSTVENHMREAEALGITGSPTFVINGRLFVGRQSIDSFRTAINNAAPIIAPVPPTSGDITRPGMPPVPPTPISPPSQACTGCQDDNTCYNYGIRMRKDAQSMYCDLSGQLEPQKELGAVCENNFECFSNQCSSGACVDIQAELAEQRSLIRRILAWFDRW